MLNNLIQKSDWHAVTLLADETQLCSARCSRVWQFSSLDSPVTQTLRLRPRFSAAWQAGSIQPHTPSSPQSPRRRRTREFELVEVGFHCKAWKLVASNSNFSLQPTSQVVDSVDNDRQNPNADVAELADALDSGSSARKGVEVQVLSSALLFSGFLAIAGSPVFFGTPKGPRSRPPTQAAETSRVCYGWPENSVALNSFVIAGIWITVLCR